MTEWLKQFYSGIEAIAPSKFQYNILRYGLEKINLLAIKVITLIFNLYGKRLFKIEDDNLIKSNECKNDRDIFYLYPIELKEIEQDINQYMTLRLDRGTINDLVLSIPWKAILTDTTIISVPNINISATLIKNTDTIYMSIAEHIDSFLLKSVSDIEIKSKQDLIEASREIHNILQSYFNKISIEVQTIRIEIVQCFELVINHLIYNNQQMNVEYAYICPIGNDSIKLLEIKRLNVIIQTLDVTIRDFIINSTIINYLPDFCTDHTNSKINLSLFVDHFALDDLLINGLKINLHPESIDIKKIINIFIKDLIDFNLKDSIREISTSIGSEANHDFPRKPINQYEQSLLTIDLHSKPTLIFHKQFSLKIGILAEVTNWFNMYRDYLNIVMKKIIYVDNDDAMMEHTSSEYIPKEPFINIQEKSSTVMFIIKNIQGLIIHKEDVINIDIRQLIHINSEFDIHDFTVRYDNLIGSTNQLKISSDLNSLKLINFGCKTIGGLNKINLNSNVIEINKIDDILNIHFNNARTNSIMEIIDQVKELINKFSSTDSTDSTNSLQINLHISKSIIDIKYTDIEFNIIVRNGIICVTDKIANDIDIDVILNGYLALRSSSKKISLDHIVINEIQIYLDPEMFDKINYLLGTLNSSNDVKSNTIIPTIDTFQKIQEAMTQSIIADNMEDFEKSINHFNNYGQTVAPIVILMQTIVDLRTMMIDNYLIDENAAGLKYKIQIKSIYVHLFDQLLTYTKSNSNGDPSFLCIVLKNIELIKITEYQIINQIKYALKINNGVIVDISTTDPQWKYFLKQTGQGRMLDLDLIIIDDSYKLNIHANPLTLSIREETVLHLLAFVSSSHQLPKRNIPTYIERFSINGVELTINYHPLILKNMGIDLNEALSLKDFKVNLQPMVLKGTSGFDRLFESIANHWKSDLNPQNIAQFVPNLRVVKPYATPIVRLVNLVHNYFNKPSNRNKIRSITKSFGHGASFVSGLIKIGINQVWDLFV